MVKETNFPRNIYGEGIDIVRPAAYYTRDIVNPCSSDVFVLTSAGKRDCPVKGFKDNGSVSRQGSSYEVPNSRVRSTWGWGHFPNGYGTGNFIGYRNTPYGDRDPRGYTRTY